METLFNYKYINNDTLLIEFDESNDSLKINNIFRSLKDLEDLNSDKCKHLIIDLRNLDIIDSFSIGHLHKIYHTMAAKKGKSIFVVNPDQYIVKILNMINLSKLYQIEKTIEDAINSL